jgi:hypothetical protein
MAFVSLPLLSLLLVFLEDYCYYSDPHFPDLDLLLSQVWIHACLAWKSLVDRTGSTRTSIESAISDLVDSDIFLKQSDLVRQIRRRGSGMDACSPESRNWKTYY